MVRVLVGGFVIAHGLVTAAMWATPAKEGEPFRATHSWLLGDVRSLAVALALVAALGFVLAGVGFLAHQSWWAVFGIGAGAVALVLMGLYFSPWLLAGIAISGGVLYAGIQALQQACCVVRPDHAEVLQAGPGVVRAVEDEAPPSCSWQLMRPSETVA